MQGGWGAVTGAVHSVLHPGDTVTSTLAAIVELDERLHYDPLGLTADVGHAIVDTLTDPQRLGQAVGALVGSVALGEAAGALGAEGETAAAAKNMESSELQLPGHMPDDFVVVKGGGKLPPAAGEEFSTSVGSTLEDASAGVPHGQIQPTTAGQIRASGGTVTRSPEMTGDIMNYQHANVVEGASPTVFHPPVPNPVPKLSRIGGPNYGK